MKESELRKLAECSICEQKIGHTGLPLFWTATIERHAIHAKAVQRQQGLAMVTGSAALAAVMGPNEDMAQSIGGPIRLSMCETCAMDQRLVITAMVAMVKDDG